jgi:hypothetical protein
LSGNGEENEKRIESKEVRSDEMWRRERVLCAERKSICKVTIKTLREKKNTERKKIK